MNNILQFRSPRDIPPPVGVRGGMSDYVPPRLSPQIVRGRDYTLADMIRINRLEGYADRRTVIAKLRVLAADEGMPLPVNPRIVRNRSVKGPRMIHARSIWDAGEVDAWNEGRHPTPPALAMQTRFPGLHAEMQRRAQAIAS